jgi:Cache domain
MRPASFRLNVRVFSVFLVVGLVMLAAASYFVIGVGQAGLRRAWGEHLRQVADQTAAAVDTYVFRLVIDASVLSRVPEVRELAASASARPFDRAAASALDRGWPRSGTAALVKDVMGNPVSTFLAETTRQNPIYRELVLTDRDGRVVAASGPTDAYLLSDAAWWKETVGDGTRGHLVVSDVRFDARARAWDIQISAPVEAPADGQLVGVLQAVVNMREIGAVLGSARMGVTGDAALVRDDGSFVFARGDVDPRARFFATDLLRERLAAATKGEPQTPLQFGAVATDGTPRLVGVAMSQLKASFPHLAWVVAVSQGEDELFAPVRAQATSLIIVLGLTAIAVLLFALWYSMRLAAPPEPEEMDMHLVRHPRVHRIEEPDEADEAEAVEEKARETV